MTADQTLALLGEMLKGAAAFGAIHIIAELIKGWTS